MRGMLKMLVGGALSVSLAVGPAIAATKGFGSRSHPYPLHHFASIPDSHGWKLRVNKAIPNATAAVLAENQFNDPPAAGRQFFMINITASYTGTGSSQTLGALTLDALGRTNVAYDSSDSCGVTPNEFDEFKTVFRGGSLSGNLCFSVKRTDVASLLLLVEPGLSFSNAQDFLRLR